MGGAGAEDRAAAGGGVGGGRARGCVGAGGAGGVDGVGGCVRGLEGWREGGKGMDGGFSGWDSGGLKWVLRDVYNGVPADGGGCSIGRLGRRCLRGFHSEGVLLPLNRGCHHASHRLQQYRS